LKHVARFLYTPEIRPLLCMDSDVMCGSRKDSAVIKLRAARHVLIWKKKWSGKRNFNKDEHIGRAVYGTVSYRSKFGIGSSNLARGINGSHNVLYRSVGAFPEETCPKDSI